MKINMFAYIFEVKSKIKIKGKEYDRTRLLEAKGQDLNSALKILMENGKIDNTCELKVQFVYLTNP